MCKKIALLAIMFIVLSAVGCNSSNIVEENGEYFLIIPELDQQGTTGENSLGLTMDMNFIPFKSVEEMISKIEQAEFDEENLQIIANRFQIDNQGRIKLFDMSHIYVPVCPEYLRIKYVLWVEGNRYSYTLEDTTGQWEHMSIRWLSEELYREQLEFYSTHSLYEEETLNSEDSTMSIFIQYFRSETGEHIPFMSVLVKQQDLCFQLSLSDIDERPSNDWLLKFSMKPYK